MLASSSGIPALTYHQQANKLYLKTDHGTIPRKTHGGTCFETPNCSLETCSIFPLWKRCHNPITTTSLFCFHVFIIIRLSWASCKRTDWQPEGRASLTDSQRGGSHLPWPRAHGLMQQRNFIMQTHRPNIYFFWYNYLSWQSSIYYALGLVRTSHRILAFVTHCDASILPFQDAIAFPAGPGAHITSMPCWCRCFLMDLGY